MQEYSLKYIWKLYYIYIGYANQLLNGTSVYARLNRLSFLDIFCSWTVVLANDWYNMIWLTFTFYISRVIELQTLNTQIMWLCHSYKNSYTVRLNNVFLKISRVTQYNNRKLKCYSKSILFDRFYWVHKKRMCHVEQYKPLWLIESRKTCAVQI